MHKHSLAELPGAHFGPPQIGNLFAPPFGLIGHRSFDSGLWVATMISPLCGSLTKTSLRVEALEKFGGENARRTDPV